MKLHTIMVIMLSIATHIPVFASTNNATDYISTKNSVTDSIPFIFNAQQASPLGRNTIHLTFGYDLKVSKDSVICYLPYFGRAFSAPLPNSEGGIRFTSTDFTITKNQVKKGGWNVIIKPNDVKDVRELNLSVSKNGYGTLYVSSNRRQSISFYGLVEDNVKKKN